MKTKKTIFSLMMVLVFLNSCGNKKSSSKNGNVSSPTVPPVTCASNCTTPPPQTQSFVLLTNLQSESEHMSSWPARLLNTQILAKGTAGQGLSPNTYVGEIMVQGILRIEQSLGDREARCRVNAGDYTFAASKVGQMTRGSNMEVLDISAGPMVIRLTQGMLWSEGGLMRWRGILSIVSVNGQSCAPFYTDML